MLVDFDDLFVQHALDHGYVTAEQVAECRRVQKTEQASGRRYYIGQILIRKRVLSCAQFLEIENELGHKLYECATCKARYGIQDLNEAGTLPCRGCGAEVRIDGAGLSIVEILASKDPRDLTISLCPTNDVNGSGVPAPAPPSVAASGPVKVQTSTRLTKEHGTTPPGGIPRPKSKLNRAVLELTKDELNGLQRYEVLEELGRGGMGIVFKARHVDIDRIVALKVIKAGPNVPEIQINRFVQEARAAAQLNHPNIVSVYDFGRFRDMFFIAMEFIPGTPLAKLIADNAITIERAIEITNDILDAVSYAHSKGVIHRDLKPQNILIETERGRGRLIDFGLAKDHSAGLGLTQTGQILGSPFYLSPEQTRGESRSVDPRSDVFAMGVILYEMITKQRPFTGKSAPEVYAKILKERPVPPSVVEPDIDQALQSIVLKALEKKPDDRFQTAAEFQHALREYQSGHATREPSRTKSGSKHRSLTGRHSRGGTDPARPAHSSGAVKRTSDRAATAITRRTQTIPAPVLEAQNTSSRGKVAAIVVSLMLVGGLGLVASQNSSTRVPTTPPPPPVEVGPKPPQPPVEVPDIDRPRDAESFAVFELERTERANPSDWGNLMALWEDLGKRFPRQASRAREKKLSLEKQCADEALALLAQVDSQSKVGLHGEAIRSLEGSLSRFEGTPWTARLRPRIGELPGEAVAWARDQVAESDRRLSRGSFQEAIAPLVSPTSTGVADADALLVAQRKKVKEALDRAAADREREIEKARARLKEQIESTKGLCTQRRFVEALAIVDAIVKGVASEELKNIVASARREIELLARVMEGASKPDIEAARAANKDLEVELKKTVKGVLLGVKDGVVSVRFAGATAEESLLKLPTRSVVKLFDLSPLEKGPDGALARLLFLMYENDVEAARPALEEARRRGADVSEYEGKFPDAPTTDKEPRTGDKPNPSNPAKVPDEKPVKDEDKMLLVPAGNSSMGTSKVVLYEHDPDRQNEMPEHNVSTEAFLIDRYEVTNHQYGKFLKWIAQNKSKAHQFCHENEPKDKDHTPALWGSAVFGGDAHPVVGVDWFDAHAYARWAKKRLPTEAEWERAARGNDGRAYPWGNAWDPKRAVSAAFWMNADTRDDSSWASFQQWWQTAPRVTMNVDSLDEGRSPYGVQHMAGNVSEWCADWYDDKYYATCWERNIVKNPQGPETGTLRSVRGGMWAGRTPAWFLTTTRGGVNPSTRTRWLGFRCVRDST